MITKICESPRKNKRHVLTMDNGKKYNFGYKFGHTYIDHHNKILRENYRKRHLSNETEKYLIENLIPSPSLFSYYLLWGPYTNIYKNIDYLNNLWMDKHKNKL